MLAEALDVLSSVTGGSSLIVPTGVDMRAAFLRAAAAIPSTSIAYGFFGTGVGTQITSDEDVIYNLIVRLRDKHQTAKSAAQILTSLKSNKTFVAGLFGGEFVVFVRHPPGTGPSPKKKKGPGGGRQ